MKNVASALSGRTPDYLVVHHMEPDHSACVAKFSELYPEAKVVVTKQSFYDDEKFFPKEKHFPPQTKRKLPHCEKTLLIN